MKKVKEFVFFFLAFVLTVALQVGVFLLLFGLSDSTTPSFVGKWHYFKLFLSDPLFFTALFNTVAPRLLWGLLAGAVIAVEAVFLQKKVAFPRFVWYIGLVVLPAAVAFLASTVVSSTVIDLIISLQIGLVVAFLFWIVEAVMQAIKKKGEQSDKGGVV